MKTKLFTKVLVLLIFLFIGNNQDAKAQNLVQDSLALVALYNSTDGDNWTNNENWLTGPVSTWYNVVVFNNRVSSIHLYNNNLVGTIPTEMEDLNELVFLNLGGNQLSGNIPTEIGNLTVLREILLHDNQLGGTIPSTIANMTNLEKLSLSGNQLTGSIPTGLGNLVNLIRLLLENNQLSGTIPPELGSLNNLERLWLSFNQLTGSIPDELGNLSSLKQLLLYENQLAGKVPGQFSNLLNLEELYIYNNQFTEFPDLSSLTLLANLKIQDNKFTFEDIEPNIGISVFEYSPQDSVGERLDTTIANGANLTLTVEVGGTANVYQWTKNGADIPSASENSFTISSADTSDSGLYACKITNTIATQLTLNSREMNVTVGGASGIEEIENEIPKEFNLSQNYPNPFNPSTNIQFSLPQTSIVTLEVINLLGESVGMLVSEELNAGIYNYNWDATGLTSGIYFYKLQAGNFVQTKKLILMK